MDFSTQTISSLLESYQKRLLSPIEVTQAYIDRITKLDREVNSFITQTAEFALFKAEKVEKYICNQVLLDGLIGVPMTLKDLIETEGIRTTAGSLIYKDHVPTQNAYIVDKLSQSDYILLGKTNMHEIALGVTNVNPHFGTCRNPWNLDRISGGSSGGSAAAISAGMCLGSVGSDTGGSIRIPASLCGIVGLKPTYGRVSMRGVLPLSWNLDHIGPMARCVKDTAAILQILAGFDPQDATSINMPIDNYLTLIDNGVKGWRIALAGDEYFTRCDDEINTAILNTEKVFQSLGATVDTIEIANGMEAAKANQLMVVSDAASIYGEQAENDPSVFGSDVLRRLKEGAGYSAPAYANARQIQLQLMHQFKHFFEIYDVLLTPTTPITAPIIEGQDAIEQARSLTRYTAPFNLTGLPAISLPCGFSKSGLPIGLQIISRWWSESALLRAAYAYEREVDWNKYHPGF